MFAARSEVRHSLLIPNGLLILSKRVEPLRERTVLLCNVFDIKTKVSEGFDNGTFRFMCSTSVCARSFRKCD
jgi:hypothetical protein